MASELVGVPSEYFPADELVGERVRLLSDYRFEGGLVLGRGEVFRVTSVVPGSRDRRKLVVRNSRVRGLGVESILCELIIGEWPGE